jgi:putative cell wall-binding protein
MLDRRTFMRHGLVGAGALTLAGRLGGLVRPELLRIAEVGVAPEAPRIITRAEWGADETIGTHDRKFAPLVKAVVHHTAIDEVDPAAQIRGIQRSHVQTNGWADIGYNFLVDREGRVYEGRWAREYDDGEIHDGEDGDGNLVIGAHATSHNPGIVGIAVLGNYTSASLTAESLAAIVRLITWKFALHAIPANGAAPYTLSSGEVQTFPNIAGHGDVDPPTTCPGPHIHERLPAIRTAVGRNFVRSVRVAGADRYDTAAKFSSVLTAPLKTVFVGSGVSFADALVAGPLAVAEAASLLLTAPDQLPEPTVTELKRLQPAQIVVLGGPVAVSDAVVEQLRPLATAGVERLAGADRFETAVAIARRLGPKPNGVVVITSGTVFADALAAGPLAASLDAPILTVLPDRIPDSTAAALRELDPSTIYVCGGTASVSDKVVSELEKVASDVRRLAGKDRYATAVAIAGQLKTDAADAVVVANGKVFADALAAGPAAVRADAPLLLVAGADVPDSVIIELHRLAPDVLHIAGGAASIPTAAEEKLVTALAQVH